MSRSLSTDASEAFGNRTSALSDPDAGAHESTTYDKALYEYRIHLTIIAGPVDPGRFNGCWVSEDDRTARGVWVGCFSLLTTRRSSMKNIMLSVIAGMCLVGFNSLSFAEDMGKMKDEMKGHQDEMKGDMKGTMGATKGMQGEMRSDMKAQHNEMKGEMKTQHNEMKGDTKDMKSEMKGTMGK
jgi:hypothetical protein